VGAACRGPWECSRVHLLHGCDPRPARHARVEFRPRFRSPSPSSILDYTDYNNTNVIPSPPRIQRYALSDYRNYGRRLWIHSIRADRSESPSSQQRQNRSPHAAFAPPGLPRLDVRTLTAPYKSPLGWGTHARLLRGRRPFGFAYHFLHNGIWWRGKTGAYGPANSLISTRTGDNVA